MSLDFDCSAFRGATCAPCTLKTLTHFALASPSPTRQFLPYIVDYATFLNILNRPGGFKAAGTAEEFIRGFQVFDKTVNGTIGAGELRYVLTSLGEKLSDAEVDELLKGVQTGP